jgi:YD repeat-containing protein
MTKLLSLSLFIMVFATRGFAQVPSAAQQNIDRLVPRPLPKSPNAAALGKFGDYDVNFFNGLPEIAIPIVDISSGDLHLPITLSYHAGGVKPTDKASWVGLGWSISAGGQVTRSVQGKPDEMVDGYSSQPLKSNPAVCGPVGTGSYEYLRKLVTKERDGEPDIFSYTFAGKSGKFLLPYGQSPFLIPAAPIVVNPYAIDKFDITDEAGIRYRFGNSIESREVTTPDIGSGAVSAWLMNDITAPNSDDQIAFSYQSVGSVTYNDISYTYVVMDQCYLQNSPQTEATCPSSSTFPQSASMSPYATQQGVKTITFENGKIEFALSSQGRADVSSLKSLDSIAVYSLVNNSYIWRKTIKFKYSYFTATGNNWALKLDEVQFKDTAGKIVQRYRFNYFTNTFSWNPAANYLAYRDWWGYYNGATQNTDLYPRKTITIQGSSSSSPFTIGGAWDRNANTQFAKEGVLKRIDFPTGGYTEFDFESHKYLDLGVPTTTGGLRVTKITSTDGLGSPPTIKTYKYGAVDPQVGHESGLGYQRFTKVQFDFNATQFSYSDCLIFGGAIVNTRVRSFHSTPAFSFEDSPVSYPVVTEYVGDPLGQILGKTVYEYDNGSAIIDPEVPDASDMVLFNSGRIYRPLTSWTKGHLSSKTIYDRNNQQVSSSTISYQVLQVTNSKQIGVGVWQFVTGNVTDCPALPPLNSSLCYNEGGEHVSDKTYLSANYYQSSGVYLPFAETETMYEPGTNKLLGTTTKKTYDSNKLQLLGLHTKKSNNDSLVTKSRYGFQLSANSSSTGAAKGVYMLNSKNIISTPIESYSYIVSGANKSITSARLTTYRQSIANPNHVVPDQIYVGEFPGNYSVSSYSPAVINGSNNGLTINGNLKPRINMINYSSEGEILAVSKVNDAPVSYQYGYNKALPIAEVKNATNTKYSYQTYSVGSNSVNISSSNSTSQTITGQFTVGSQGGSVTLTLEPLTNIQYTVTIHYDFSPSLSASTFDLLPYGSPNPAHVTFNNVPPGTYPYSIYFVANGAGGTVVGNVQYPASQTTYSGMTEFSYENFEEGSVTTSPLTAHTGKGYVTSYSPTFTIPTTNPMRSYTIEYWYWNGSAWVYTAKPYTGGTLVNEGSAYDNVRIYPTDARMKSYTYDPILGITSVIDENGTVMYYDYDSFGRLARIRNDKGGVEKQYTYHYKGQ